MPDRPASPVPLTADPCARRAVARRLLGPVQREVDMCVRRFASAGGRDTRQDAHDLAQDVLVSLFDRDARELRRWDPARGRSFESFVRLVARRRVTRARPCTADRTGSPSVLRSLIRPGVCPLRGMQVADQGYRAIQERLRLRR